MATVEPGIFKSFPYANEVDNFFQNRKGMVTFKIHVFALSAMYRDPKNLMVFCSGTGAMIGSFATWYKGANGSTLVGVTGIGAGLGMLFAKFFPEQMRKVHQYVMSFFGVKFEDTTSEPKAGPAAGESEKGKGKEEAESEHLGEKLAVKAVETVVGAVVGAAADTVAKEGVTPLVGHATKNVVGTVLGPNDPAPPP